MEEKTILQWFEQAKAEGLEWADAAIEATMQLNPKDAKWQTISMYKALGIAFVWAHTTQGHAYWREIAESLKK